MSSRLIRLPRPEGGAERDILWYVNHNCPQAKAIKPALEDSGDLDLLQFSVGLVGWEMPLNIPFDVQSSNCCDACGSYVRAWFEWMGPKLIIPRLVSA